MWGVWVSEDFDDVLNRTTLERNMKRGNWQGDETGTAPSGAAGEEDTAECSSKHS
jgi:hypothetical protein